MDDAARQNRQKNRRLVDQQLKDKPRRAFAMPNNLTIEPGAVCSLKCAFCPQSDPAFDLPRGLLTLGDFKKIVDSFEGHLEYANLFNWGEPLLNPELSKMIRHISEKEIYSVVHSSLNFLTPAVADELVASGLSELAASIDGASEETYSKYRVNGSFSTAFKNLRMLITAKKKLGLAQPKIFWKFLVFRHNEHEIAAAKNMADDMEIEIKFQFAAANKKSFESTLENYNGKDFLKKFVRDYDSPCEALWRNPIVHADGTVLPCCMISQKKHAAGNLFREDFKSIWNNDKYQEIRDVISGRAQASEALLCHRCIFNPTMDNARYYQI